MRIVLVALLVTTFLDPSLLAQSQTGSMCIAPFVPDPADNLSAPGLFCASGKFSLKLDAQPPISWPKKESVKVDSLDLTGNHRVVVFCDGKPQQSFSFRFSEFKSTELCLFLNDLYKTAQLWEAKRSPWCRCK
jgi:hypothetical protein